MRFGVLGPVEVWDGGRLLPLGGPRERFLLGRLLLADGRVVPAERLIDELWGERPPTTAKAQLHNLVSKVRGRLRAGADGLIVSRPPGYELRLDPHELDVVRFRDLAERGRRAAADGDHTSAATALTGALALWRGPALADVPEELAGGIRRPLHEERLFAAEAWADAELGLGRYERVLCEVTALLAEHPYRERLWAQRLLALVGSGQRAAALAAYQQVHRRFVDDLGVEPGAELRRLQRQILCGESDLRSAALPVPRQLPPAEVALTGRDELLAAITAELRRSPDVPPPVVLVGPGGVGKTALALAAGHGCAAAFPDGQLYGDLRGSRGDPADPHAVLGRFLCALGIGGARLPVDREERLAMFRSLLAGRRMLLVLDDAATEAQVRPLIPATAGCRVLLTSRRRLGALLRAGRWTVPALAPPDAVELLAGVIGRQRVAAEPDAAATIVELCALMPLAVSVAAARLAVQPHRRLAEFHRRLAAERGRLDELAIGDLDVRASIALSYRLLDPGLRRLLRRLGLVDAPDWPSWVALALVGASASDSAGDSAGAADTGAELLDRLVDVHLVEPLGRDALGQSRFRLHDLVAAFARERALAEDGDAERAGALSRMLSGWLALATVADEAVPHHLVRPPAADPPELPSGAVRLDRDSATEWFEIERRSLVSAVGQACRSAWPDLAGLLALRLSGFLALRSYDDDWEATLRPAIRCAREHGTHPMLVRLLDALFIAGLRRDRHEEISAIAVEELGLAEALGDWELQARALTNAGRAAWRRGRLAESVGWLERAVVAARHPAVAGELLRDGLASAALLHLITGQAAQAVPLFEEALAIDRDPRPSTRTALHRYQHGMALTAAGRLDDAECALAQAQQVCDALGETMLGAYLEQTLADVDIRRGRLRRAAERLDRALATHERIGNDDALAETLRSTGDLAAAEGRWPEAIDWLRRAADLWRGVDSRVEIARTLARLERTHAALGQHDAAGSCRQEYRTILSDLGLGDACLYLPPPYCG